MKAIARFINGKLAGYQYAKDETIGGTESSNPHRWALEWATKSTGRTVEVVDEKDWKPDSYERHIRPVKTEKDKLIDLLDDPAVKQKIKTISKAQTI